MLDFSLILIKDLKFMKIDSSVVFIFLTSFIILENIFKKFSLIIPVTWFGHYSTTHVVCFGPSPFLSMSTTGLNSVFLFLD